MPSTNKTPFLGLSNFEGTDKPNWPDWNTDMQKLDEYIKEVKELLDLLKENKEDVATEFSQIGKQSISINNDFRINQQAKASYTEAGNAKKYTVDGFYTSKGTLSVIEGGVTFQASSQFGLLAQIVEIPEYLRGKSVSLVIDATGLAGHRMILAGTYSGRLTDGINVFTRVLPNEATVLMQFIDTSSSGFNSTTIRRFGLFLGSFNGFEPTEPTIEKIRCQRYMQNLNSGVRNMRCAWGFINKASVRIEFILPLSAPMRITPTLSMSGKLQAVRGGVGYDLSDISISTNGNILLLSGTNENILPDMPYSLEPNYGNIIILDANL